MIELLLSILGTLCAAGIKIACEQYFKSRYEGEIREEVKSCFWWRKSRQDDRKKRYMRVSMINSDEWDVDDDDDDEETGTKEKGDKTDKEHVNTHTEMVECQTGDSLINNTMSRSKDDTLFLEADSNCTTSSEDNSSVSDSDRDSDSDSVCNNGSQEELVSLIK